jgi:formylglycine-generating enzyme required for sulfatase activity/predicted Ser/Thr protein kinase
MNCPICTATLRDDSRFCPVCGANITNATTGRLKVGRTLAGRYQIVRLIARGGMGAVYLATDQRLDDVQVAVKEMSSIYSPGDTAAFAQAVADFRREAAMLARLSHPNLPRVFDRFEEEGKQFLVMELVEGKTLRQVLLERGGQIELNELRGWALQLCDVLGYLHKQQPPIIYRDLKPSNVMLRPDGRLALIDFGIARFYKPGQNADTAIYGTMGYAAPEQYGEGQSDQRTDIYAMGVLFYHALTGYDVTSTPFRLPPIQRLRPDLPPHVANLITRSIALEPNDRFSSVDEIAAQLRQITDTSAITAQPEPQTTKRQSGMPIWAFIGVLVLIIGLVGGTFLALNNRSPSQIATPPISATTEYTPTAGAQQAPTAQQQSTPIENTVSVALPPDMLLVPAGIFTMGADNDSATAPAHSINISAPFLIERTEVTNRAYRACVNAGICQPPTQNSSLTHDDYFTNTAYDNYPVVNVTWQQARDFCAWRGRRLPTEAEWEYAARGSDERPYPWGDTWDENNLRLTGADLTNDLIAVGSYPQNASPFGALDMVGNVWEWTSSRDLQYPYAAGDGRELTSIGGNRIVRGGAWGNDPTNARTTTRDSQDPNYANWNLGIRCAADLPTLTANILPDDLPTPPEGMVAVPGGILIMGSTREQIEQWSNEYGWELMIGETPQSIVTIGPFLLDRTEVTNQQYAAFMAATGHPAPSNPFNPNELNIWRDGTFPPDLADHPVVNVTWHDARAYCAWAGGRLPSEAEWEWAARGPEGWLWPWGNTFDQTRLNSKESDISTTQSADNNPDGASWVGALNMAGNVWEWTSSLAWPYPYNQIDGREDANSNGSRQIRGGSWYDTYIAGHTSNRNPFDTNLANVNVGFRCAR